MKNKEKGIRLRPNTKNSNAYPKTNHLLVIGINAYQNGIPVLNNAVKDAQVFAAILEERYQFKSENITELYDNEATADRILEAFDQLRDRLTDTDNLIIYFSGHGELVEESQRGYWIPVDARLDKRRDYINNTEVTDFIKTCKARHILGIVDACYSGPVLRRVTAAVLDKYYTKPSRQIMSSGSIEPVPDGLPDYHSPFAAALIAALKHNQLPYLSTSSLWNDMKEGLASNTKATAIFEPLTDVGHQGGDYFFIDKNANEMPPIPVVTGNNSPERNINPPSDVITPPKQKEVPLPTITNAKSLKTALRPLQLTDVKAAFELLIKHLDEDSSYMSTAYIRLSELNSLEQEIAAGTAMNVPQRKAQITHALDYIIKNISDDDLKK